METPNKEANKALRELHILRAHLDRLDKAIRDNHLSITPLTTAAIARNNDLINGLIDATIGE